MYHHHHHFIWSHLFPSPEWVAIAAALFLGTNILQDWFRSRYRARLEPIEVVPTVQEHDGKSHFYQRLIIKNIGTAPATNVRVLLTYVIVPKNFIPIPLRWTHVNSDTRDISIGEPAYLDIVSKKAEEPQYRFAWPAGSPSEPLLKHFKPELGDIRLELFGSDKKIGDIVLSYKNDTFTIVPRERAVN